MTPALLWPALAASFVLGLAAVIRMADPSPGAHALTGVIRLSEPVRATIVTLFALSAVVFAGDVARRLLGRRRGDGEPERPPEPRHVPAWLRGLAQVASLVNLVVLAWLVWRGALPLDGLLALVSGAGAVAGLGPEAAVPSAPQLLTWTFGALAIAAGLGALLLALWVALGDRLAARGPAVPEPPPAAALEAAVAAGLDDLRAEPDARRAIARCYARFEQAAADAGLPRRPWLTPAEFMGEALGRVPEAHRAVAVLTGLFEVARFSDHALGGGDRDRALAALDEIREAMAAGGGGVLAR